MCLSFKQAHPKSLLRTFFNQYLPKKLVASLQGLWWQDLAEVFVANVPDKRLRAIAQQTRSWSIKPSGTEGYRTAEVTSGGINTRDLDSKTMESKTQSGLYFIGEVVDVTGELGGYNFQWAWASGFVAGESVYGWVNRRNKIQVARVATVTPTINVAVGISTAVRVRHRRKH